MQIILSQHMLNSIDTSVSQAHSKSEILDVYQEAIAIQKLHPHDNVALEDIVSELIHRAKPNTAMSFISPEVLARKSSAMLYMEIVDTRNKELSPGPFEPALEAQ